jgi:hypothetical protein
MPKFRVSESSIIRVPLPLREEDNKPIKIVADKDLKVSLTFLNSKLIIPWIIIFDAKVNNI